MATKIYKSLEELIDGVHEATGDGEAVMCDRPAQLMVGFVTPDYVEHMIPVSRITRDRPDLMATREGRIMMAAIMGCQSRPGTGDMTRAHLETCERCCSRKAALIDAGLVSAARPV